MAEILIRFNKVYGKFYSRDTGRKVYRSNFGSKFSDIAFKRAREAIEYKTRVMLRYMNLNMAHKAWLEEQNKVVSPAHWYDRLLARIRGWISWMTLKMQHDPR